jgi:hypothetical protein
MVHELDDLVEEDAGGGDPHPVGDGEHGPTLYIAYLNTKPCSLIMLSHKNKNKNKNIYPQPLHNKMFYMLVCVVKNAPLIIEKIF